MLKPKLLAESKKNSLFSSGDKVSVAISGGPDSTALLYTLNDIKDQIGITLTACHMNHNLRGAESDEDQLFVERICNELSIDLTVKSADVRKYKAVKRVSMQVAARELRYLFFESLMRLSGTDKIALAHTWDDNAETVLMNLLRGSGPKGLSGIPSVRNQRIVRPFINISKEEILKYLGDNKFEYRVDSSNKKSYYLRNKIREELIPELEEAYNPSIKSSLNKTSIIMSDIEEYLATVAAQEFKKLATVENKKTVLDLDMFLPLDKVIQRELLKVAIRREKGNSTNISFDHIESLMKFCATGKSGELDLPELKAAISGKKISIQRSSFSECNLFSNDFVRNRLIYLDEIDADITSRFAAPEEVRFDEQCSTVFVDFDAMPSDVVIRNRIDGDRFQPLGSNGGRKLKEFFIDAKVPSWERDSIPLLASGSEILWIAGVRLSEKLKISSDTKRILKIEFLKN